MKIAIFLALQVAVCFAAERGMKFGHTFVSEPEPVCVDDVPPVAWTPSDDQEGGFGVGLDAPYDVSYDSSGADIWPWPVIEYNGNSVPTTCSGGSMYQVVVESYEGVSGDVLLIVGDGFSWTYAVGAEEDEIPLGGVDEGYFRMACLPSDCFEVSFTAEEVSLYSDPHYSSFTIYSMETGNMVLHGGHQNLFHKTFCAPSCEENGKTRFQLVSSLGSYYGWQDFMAQIENSEGEALIEYHHPNNHDDEYYNNDLQGMHADHFDDDDDDEDAGAQRRMDICLSPGAYKLKTVDHWDPQWSEDDVEHYIGFFKRDGDDAYAYLVAGDPITVGLELPFCA